MTNKDNRSTSAFTAETEPSVPVTPMNPNKISAEDVDVVTSQIVGCILKSRYLIGRQLDQGSFGKIYKVIDLEDKDRPLVIKICAQTNLFAKEVSAMQNITSRKNVSECSMEIDTPEVIAYGMLMVSDDASVKIKLSKKSDAEKNMLSYLIMPRFGRNIEQYFEKQKRILNKASIYHLGLACLDFLEQVHNAGYIYNDLKLDNLLIDLKHHLPSKVAENQSCFAKTSINLVDFGFATKYTERNAEKKVVHIEKHQVDVFRSNIIFSSTHQLQFYSTGRRDDLISLVYLLIFLCNRGSLPKLDMYGDKDHYDMFKETRDVKLAYKMRDLCNEDAGTQELEEFVREVFSYRFKDRPNYDKLRQSLRSLYQKYTESEKPRSVPPKQAVEQVSLGFNLFATEETKKYDPNGQKPVSKSTGCSER